jgi:hypothetical protein
MPKVTITRSEMEIALERLKGWPSDRLAQQSLFAEVAP